MARDINRCCRLDTVPPVTARLQTYNTIFGLSYIRHYVSKSYKGKTVTQALFGSPRDCLRTYQQGPSLPGTAQTNGYLNLRQNRNLKLHVSSDTVTLFHSDMTSHQLSHVYKILHCSAKL